MNDSVIVDGRVLHTNSKSYLIDFEGDEHWIPISLCKLHKDDQVEVPKWKMRQMFPDECY